MMKLLFIEVLIFFLHSSAADFDLRTNSSVVGSLAGTVSLSCSLSPSQDALGMQVEWFYGKSIGDVQVFFYSNGKGQGSKGYEFRAKMDQSQMTSGILSLVLSNLTSADSGNYWCKVIDGALEKYVMTELKVGHMGTRPEFQMDKYASRIVTLSCVSNDWYPAPVVSWVVGEDGKPMASEKSEDIANNKAHINVRETLSLRAENDLQVTCIMSNPVLGTKTQETLRITGDFPPDVSPWFIAFIVLFLIVLAIAAWVAWKFWEKKKIIKEKKAQASEAEKEPLLEEFEREKKDAKAEYEKLKKELDQARIVNGSEWNRIQNHKNPNVTLLNSDGKSSTPFSSGHHYWEVDVGEKNWAAGLVKEGVELKGGWDVLKNMSPDKGVWALAHKSNLGYRALIPTSTGPFPITPASDPKKLGCLLDWDEKQLSIYDVGRTHRLFTFDCDSDKPVYPFLRLNI
ncbi:butyrophilin subfamily 1 member A1-like [Polypterus senegalus]|uniref:butyrophilin subfamily 1 member A1-like n=1 Tax=Polypterus senegalus TaxID=55291 RepID=UPI0019640808|nr:butyrophilin subfamily 1 member A1-like [Polypterus senegalus]